MGVGAGLTLKLGMAVGKGVKKKRAKAKDNEVSQHFFSAKRAGLGKPHPGHNRDSGLDHAPLQ